MFNHFSQLHLQSSLHFQFAFLHEHLVLQPLTLLQPHFTSSEQAFEATSRVVHTGSHKLLSPSSVQPFPSGEGVCCCVKVLVVQIPAW